METKRKIRMMFRWSLASSALIALFWAMWYLAYGGVPVACGISRWWDVLAGPAWSIAMILVFANERILNDKDATPFIIPAIPIGLFASLFLGLAIGLAIALAIDLVAALFIGALYAMICALEKGRPIGNWLMAKNNQI